METLHLVPRHLEKVDSTSGEFIFLNQRDVNLFHQNCFRLDKVEGNR